MFRGLQSFDLRRSAVFFALLAALPASSKPSFQPTGNIQGVITDPTGAAWCPKLQSPS